MSKSIEECCLDVAWSQWVELGVSGSNVLVPQDAVDLEAAIVFAPLLFELDRRLHDEVLDWCIQYAGQFTSVSCLKHVLKQFDPEHQQKFERFASIVNRYGGTKWPTSVKVAPAFTPSEKSRCRVERPGAVHLRSRKIFGINARADILVGLALLKPTPQHRWTHVNYLLDLGYSKRSLRDALFDLHVGGVLGTMNFGNTIRYALKKPDLLRTFLDPLPHGEGRPWGKYFAVASSLISADRRTKGKTAITRAVEARKVLERRQRDLEASRVVVPTLGDDPWPVLEEWLGSLLRP